MPEQSLAIEQEIQNLERQKDLLNQTYQQQINQPGISQSQFQFYSRGYNEELQNIRFKIEGYQRAKSFADSGYTSQSISEFAQSVASQEAQRANSSSRGLTPRKSQRSISFAGTTQTERELNMSLNPDLRNLPAKEVRKILTTGSGFKGTTRAERDLQQSLVPELRNLPTTEVQSRQAQAQREAQVRGLTIGEFGERINQRDLQRAFTEESFARQQSLDPEQFLDSPRAKSIVRSNTGFFGFNTLSGEDFGSLSRKSRAGLVVRESGGEFLKGIESGLRFDTAVISGLPLVDPSGILLERASRPVLSERFFGDKPTTIVGKSAFFVGSLVSSLGGSAFVKSKGIETTAQSLSFEQSLGRGLQASKFKTDIGVIGRNAQGEDIFIGVGKRGFPGIAEQTAVFTGTSKDGLTKLPQIELTTILKNPSTGKNILSQREFFSGGAVSRDVDILKAGKPLDNFKINLGESFTSRKLKTEGFASIKKDVGSQTKFFELDDFNLVKTTTTKSFLPKTFARLQEPSSDIFEEAIAIKKIAPSKSLDSFKGRFKLTEGVTTVTDLRKSLGSIEDSGIKILRGGGKKTPFSTTFTEQKTISSNLGSINKILGSNAPKISPPKSISIISPPKQSQFYGTGQYELTSGGLAPRQQRSIQIFNTREPELKDRLSLEFINLRDNSNFKQRSGSLNVLGTPQLNKISNAQINVPAQFQPQPSRLRQGEVNLQVDRQVTQQTNPPNIPRLDFNFRYNPPRFRPPVFLPGGDISSSRPSRKAMRRSFTRIPSLVALEFNIKSFKPSKFEETGLVVRPILKLKKPKRRKRR